MKRKILALALAVALIAIAVIGGTLAYFTDTDYAINVLTSGNVEILLHEDNNDGKLDKEYRDWLEAQKFHPGVELEKDVWVENTGSNEAYVRVFIAYPYNAKDVMTLSWDDLSMWSDDVSGYKALNTYDKLNSELGSNGHYTTVIGDQQYIVRCLTYKTPLEAGAKTPDNLTKVTMVPETEVKLVGEEIVYYNPTVMHQNTESDFPETYYLEYYSENGQIPVYICAQAVQTTTFADAAEAFNAAFGEYDVAWWVVGKTVTGNETITGAVATTGTAITVDENIQVTVNDATITADQLAVFNENAWMYIKDTTVECEKGINLQNTNTTIILDNVHFNLDDGEPVVYGELGGQVVYLMGPIFVNGVEYDFSAAMKTEFFPNVLVFKMY